MFQLYTHANIHTYIYTYICGFHIYMASKVALVIKNPLTMKRGEFDHRVRKILWRRAWQPTPVLLPGEYHGQRNLAGYSPQGHKEWDMTEVT